MFPRRIHRQKAFTLVELAVVLLIIGLLVGGVLGAQSLIRSSEIRGVLSDADKYLTAISTFREKYLALPGDMPNATTYWGVAHATPATCKTTAAVGKETCNGTGDGKIAYWDTGTTETFRFWQHLANAEMIEGKYTGATTGPLEFSTYPGVNIPASKITGSAFYVQDMYNGTDPIRYSTYLGNTMQLGAQSFGGGTNYGALFTPNETRSIDLKIDDGRPAYGNLIALLWDTCTDAANNADLESDYLPDNSTTSCGIMFKIGNIN